MPVGVATTDRPASLDLITEGESTILNQQLLTEFVLYQGDTTFRPPDWEFRFIPVLNFQQVMFDERGILKVTPDGGKPGARCVARACLGFKASLSISTCVTCPIALTSTPCAWASSPLPPIFRGFLFQDQQPGVRLFGTRNNNIFQYNLAWFRRLEKDTNIGLNNLSEDIRDDDVYIANLYWQDMPVKGHTSQVTVVHNRNREKDQVKFDDNGFIARPASLFGERFAQDYDVTYLGYNGDGHFGRINLSSLYYAVGTQTSERFRNAEDEIEAGFAAFEAGFDDNWIRYRISGLYATGDDDPFDDQAKGFDAIFENPLFAGADTSFWIRQPVPLIGGGAVSLSGRNGILNSLRSSKEQGQSNFINPGTMLLGLGADFDITPETRVSVNANQLWFDDTSVLEAARNQGNIDREIGTDLSLSIVWRPLMIQNVVFRLSGAALLPGDGFEDLFWQ